LSGWITSGWRWAVVIALVVLPLVALLISRRRKWSGKAQVLTTGAALIVCAGLLAWFLHYWPTEKKPEDFTVICTTSFLSPIRNTILDYGILHRRVDSHELVLSPVPVILYIQIVNRGPISAMINEYGVQFRDGPGEWRDVTQIQAEHGTILYLREGLEKAKEFNFQDLNVQLANKNLTPGETVQGWIFLDMEGASTAGQWRFQIRTTAATESFAEFKIRSNSTFDNQPQSPSLRAGKYQDVRRIPWAIYSDVISPGSVEAWSSAGGSIQSTTK
jgi:hypothetical protein